MRSSRRPARPGPAVNQKLYTETSVRRPPPPDGQGTLLGPAVVPSLDTVLVARGAACCSAVEREVTRRPPASRMSALKPAERDLMETFVNVTSISHPPGVLRRRTAFT